MIHNDFDFWSNHFSSQAAISFCLLYWVPWKAPSFFSYYTMLLRIGRLRKFLDFFAKPNSHHTLGIAWTSWLLSKAIHWRIGRGQNFFSLFFFHGAILLRIDEEKDSCGYSHSRCFLLSHILPAGRHFDSLSVYLCCNLSWLSCTFSCSVGFKIPNSSSNRVIPFGHQLNSLIPVSLNNYVEYNYVEY